MLGVSLLPIISMVFVQSGRPQACQHLRTPTLLRMGLFDGVQSAVEGVKAAYEEGDSLPEGFAKAYHILFLEEDDAQRKADGLRARIEAGDISFYEAAVRFSACPTRDIHGSLGCFSSLSNLGKVGPLGVLPYQGQDTTPFDSLVFSPTSALGVVHQVDTQWGVHLVLIEARGAEVDSGMAQALRAAGPRPEAADLVSQAAELVGRASAPVTDAGAGAPSFPSRLARQQAKQHMQEAGGAGATAVGFGGRGAAKGKKRKR